MTLVPKVPLWSHRKRRLRGHPDVHWRNFRAARERFSRGDDLPGDAPRICPHLRRRPVHADLAVFHGGRRHPAVPVLHVHLHAGISVLPPDEAQEGEGPAKPQVVPQQRGRRGRARRDRGGGQEAAEREGSASGPDPGAQQQEGHDHHVGAERRPTLHGDQHHADEPAQHPRGGRVELPGLEGGGHHLLGPDVRGRHDRGGVRGQVGEEDPSDRLQLPDGTLPGGPGRVFHLEERWSRREGVQLGPYDRLHGLRGCVQGWFGYSSDHPDR